MSGKPPYFVDKKGEVNELRALLRNHSMMRVASKKRDIIKKVKFKIWKFRAKMYIVIVTCVCVRSLPT